ncbi:MAG: hypothetical protein ACE5JK_02395 [Candidatus Omnitrophota bacterium]
MHMGDDMSIGMPFGGGTEEADLSLCPMGATVINNFLMAWKVEDYETMYNLYDDESKKDYPFAQAKFDLRMLEYKPFTISSVRKDGDNFEFLLSHGDWKDGDKVLRKVIINGESFKIIKQSGNSPFKRSAEDYF